MTGKHAAARTRSHRPASGGTLPRLRPRAASGWRRLTGSASATAVAFGLLACACALVAVAGPRTSAHLRTTALSQLAATTPPLETAVVGTLDAGSLGDAMNEPVGQSQLQLAEAQLRSNLAKALPLAGAGSGWAGLTTPFGDFADKAQPLGAYEASFELAYRDPLSRNARVIAGALPSGKPVIGSGGTVTLPAAITAATAKRYVLGVGSRVPLPDAGIVLRVSGIVAPADPVSTFWTLDPIVAAPVLVQPQLGSPYWQGGAFVSAAALPVLDKLFSPPDIQLNWVFGLGFGHLTPAQADSLAQTMPDLLAAAGQLNFSGFQAPVSLTSGATAILAEFALENSAIANVLDLMSVSLAVVGAAVVLLAAWLMAEKRREEFGVLRARGASRRQLAAASLAGSAVAALPGAAAGIALGVLLTPGAGSPLAWWLAGLTVLAALAGPVLITVRVHRGYAGLARPDRPASRMASVRRLIAECALAAGSVGGLVVLRDQGVGPGGGDLYASAAPVLAAIPVAIVLLRLYPLLVRPLLALAGRRTGVTAFLGLARAARVSAAAVLPAFAMVLALSLVAFAGMVRGAVERGEVAQSWQQAGADAVVSVPGAMTAAQRRAIAAVPGVRLTELISVSRATQGLSGPGLDVVLADPAQYAGLLAATPLAHAPASFADWRPSPGAGSTGAGSAGAGSAGAGNTAAVPVLASPGLATQFGSAPVSLLLQGGVRARIQVVGTAPAMSQVQNVGGPSSGGFIVLPRSALAAAAVPPPSVMLVAGLSLDDSALKAAVARWHLGGAGVTLRAQLLRALEQAPLQHGTYTELARSGVAAAIGCLLVLLLTLLLSAQSRQMTLARAATMGMSTAQGRWLALIEALPQIVSVLIGGLICALALAPLVGPTLGLSVFTDSATAVPVRVEPAWLAATAIGLLVLAIATLTGQTMVASRGTARSLRIGG